MTSISIIVPVFQDPDGIRHCLYALAGQTCQTGNFEVVVVDNGSAPPIKISDTYPFKVVLIHCSTPGAYAARNAGVHASSGKIIAFTDADCTPRPDWINNGVAALLTDNHEKIIGGEVLISKPTTRTAVGLYQHLVGFGQAENIEYKGFSATANIFCHRRTFDRVGPFKDTLLSGGDREWAWRARLIGIKTEFAPDAIVETSSRTTLRGAIRQARRVSAGRYHLKKSGLAPNQLQALKPHRSMLASFWWVASHPTLGLADRFLVLGTGGIIKAASILESIRIRLGGSAERR